MTRIRAATSLDLERIREVHFRAFAEGERQIVSTLAVNLLSSETSPETVALIAERNGTVVGHIAFSPVTVDGNEEWKGYILAPLGVTPEYQGLKIGSKLIESGIARISDTGANVLFVYGDPDYYGKFGFTAEAASRYSPPYALQYPFGWQAIILNEVGSLQSTANISCVPSLCDPKFW